MRRVWLVVFATLVFVGTPTAAAAPAGFSLPGCYSADTPQRPANFVLQGCMQNGMWLTDMTWSAWDNDGAEGTGTVVVNTCEYSCADSRSRVSNPVVVHATDPEPAPTGKCPSGVQFYRKLTLALPGGRPPGVDINDTYQGMPAATLASPAGNPNQWGYVMCS